jgi:hypothetical protein
MPTINFIIINFSVCFYLIKYMWVIRYIFKSFFGEFICMKRFIMWFFLFIFLSTFVLAAKCYVETPYKPLTSNSGGGGLDQTPEPCTGKNSIPQISEITKREECSVRSKSGTETNSDCIESGIPGSNCFYVVHDSGIPAANDHEYEVYRGKVSASGERCDVSCATRGTIFHEVPVDQLTPGVCASGCTGGFTFATDATGFRCCTGVCSNPMLGPASTMETSYYVTSGGKTTQLNHVVESIYDSSKWTKMASFPTNVCNIEGKYYVDWEIQNQGGVHYSRIKVYSQFKQNKNIYKVSWDLQEGSCTDVDCYVDETARGWYEDDQNPLAAGKMCCGDDNTDTGTVFQNSEHICGIYMTDQNNQDEIIYGYKWGYAKGNNDVDNTAVKGDVLLVTYPEPYDVVSSGSKWRSCGRGQNSIALWNKISVTATSNSALKHSYLCFKEGDTVDRYAFAECLGESGESININGLENDVTIGRPSHVGASLPFAVEIEANAPRDFSGASNEPSAINTDHAISGTRIESQDFDNTKKLSGEEGYYMPVIVNGTNLGGANIEFPVTTINRWDAYSHLQAPIRFGIPGDRSATSAPIDLQINFASGVPVVIENILRYSTDGIEEYEWHLLRIPIQAASGRFIRNISFIFDPKYANYVNGFDYEFWTDRMTLTKTGSNARVYYCTEYTDLDNGNVYYDWIDDLDYNMNFQEGKIACNAREYSGWTGSRCCGDDSNPNVDGVVYVQKKEFYTDNESGCWSGQVINEDVPLQIYDLNFNEKPFTFECGDEDGDCMIPIPPLLDEEAGESITITGADAMFTNFTQGGEVNGTTTDRFVDSVLLRKEQPEITYYNGTMWGCHTPYKGTKGTDNSGAQSTEVILEDINYERDGQLVDGGSCVIKGSYFCDPEGYWSDDTSMEALDIVTLDPANNTVTYHNFCQPDSKETQCPEFNAVNRTKLSKDYHNNDYSCCPDNYCWNGSICIENMANRPWAPPLEMDGNGSGNRCVDGFWNWNLKKYDWYHKDSGWCPDNNDCLVHNSTQAEYNSSANPQCVHSGEYTGDYYCDAGTWSTRTKVVGTYLQSVALQESPDDYSLFCDHFDTALNYVGTVDNKDMRTVLQGLRAVEGAFFTESICDIASTSEVDECVNNFCVLRYDDDKVIIGTSLNAPLDTNGTIGSHFGIESCLGNGGEFADCGDGWFYHEDMMLLIYNPNAGGIIPELTEFISFIVAPIVNFFKALISWHEDSLEPMPSQLSGSLDYLSETTLFDALYIAQSGEKRVLGTKETKWDNSEGMLIEYIGVGYDNFPEVPFLCDYIEAYDTIHDTREDFTCHYDVVTTNTSSVATYSVFSKSDVGRNVWADLTAVLRIDE